MDYSPSPTALIQDEFVRQARAVHIANVIAKHSKVKGVKPVEVKPVKESYFEST
jgi:hypothetical protein